MITSRDRRDCDFSTRQVADSDRKLVIVYYRDYCSQSATARRIAAISSVVRGARVPVLTISPIFRRGSSDDDVWAVDMHFLSILDQGKLLSRVLALVVFNIIAFFRILRIRSQILAVQYETIYSFPAVFFASLLCHLPCIGDDVIIPQVLRRMRVLELMLASGSDLILSASKEVVSGLHSKTRTLHVPAGVIGQFTVKRKSISFRKITAVFVGTLTYDANRRAAYKIVKAASMVSNDGRCTFLVIGRPAPEWAVEGDNVRFLGGLSDEALREIYKCANVGLLPFFGIRSEGPKVKLLDYLAAELLVISSPEGVEGYPGLKAWGHYVPATSESEMVQRLMTLRDNPRKFAKIARRGHEYALSKYQWPPLLEDYLAFVQELRSRSG